MARDERVELLGDPRNREYRPCVLEEARGVEVVVHVVEPVDECLDADLELVELFHQTRFRRLARLVLCRELTPQRAELTELRAVSFECCTLTSVLRCLGCGALSRREQVDGHITDLRVSLDQVVDRDEQEDLPEVVVNREASVTERRVHREHQRTNAERVTSRTLGVRHMPTSQMAVDVPTHARRELQGRSHLHESEYVIVHFEPPGGLIPLVSQDSILSTSRDQVKLLDRKAGQCYSVPT